MKNILFSLLALSSFAVGALDPQLMVGKDKLVLNGTGFRTATIFKVRVYEAGLYLPQKSKTPLEILPQYPKKVALVFLRDVDKEDIAKAWDSGFTKNCEKECDKQIPALEKLKSLLVSVKEKDKLAYTLWKDKVELFLNDKKLGEVQQSSFSDNLLLTWLGKEPPNEELKTGLLGIK